MMISMFNIFSGIDEAALGPILGPYCCALASFKVSDNRELFDIFSELNNVKICDSKKLYTSGKSIKQLENTALSFYSCFFQRKPDNVYNLLNHLLRDKKQLQELQNIPWFKNLKILKLPIVCESNEVEQNSEVLRIFLLKKKLELTVLKVDVVSAERFNNLLSRGFNKSQCCQKILTPLLQCSQTEQSRLTVDRQGGRRYYGEWLIDIFPGTSISINRETHDLSSYNISDSTIQFQVKGDDKYLETALASIFSKYIRELMMISFNKYWNSQFPQIMRTAGYPQDGKRFVKELNFLGAIYKEDQLIRQK